MFCILREDLNEIVENKVIDVEYLKMDKDDLREKEKNLCKALLSDYEKNGFYLPFQGRLE